MVETPENNSGIYWQVINLWFFGWSLLFSEKKIAKIYDSLTAVGLIIVNSASNILAKNSHSDKRQLLESIKKQSSQARLETLRSLKF